MISLRRCATVNEWFRDLDAWVVLYPVHLLEEVRSATLDALARRTDDWLYVSWEGWGGYPMNDHFAWFHMIEDEISHRGQIRWLRRHLPGAP